MFIITVLLMGAFEFKASAVTSGTTSNCTWSLDGTLLTIYGNGSMENYDYYNSAPWGTNITSVVIKDGVTNIGDYAFYKCQNLKSVALTDSIIKIGESAFSYCSAIKSIIIPNKVEFIDESAFRSCVGLKYIVIPKNMSGIAAFAFTGCQNLTDVYYCGGINNKNFPIQEDNYYFSYYSKWHYNIIVNNCYSMGDVDNDGNSNLNDLVLLAQFVADWNDIPVNILASDVNIDNSFDLQDITHLARYLAGWDVTLH